jgi:predicted amidohydrolase
MKLGLVQMRSGIDPAASLRAAEGLIRQAAGAGARLVATPETTHLVQKDAEALWRTIRTPEEDPAIAFFGDLARELEIDLLIGSLALQVGERRAVNRSYLFGPDGAVKAHYDKAHMFDVAVGAGETYRESANYQAGDRLVVAEAAGAQLGLTICYDIRFAYQYRALAQAGAQILAVPAAFTRPTGRAHWEILLKARAIETGSYVIAPAQGGLHEDGRRTWGRSVVIGPWGETVAALEDDAPGVLMAEIDLAKTASARTRIPALEHDRVMIIAETSQDAERS